MTRLSRIALFSTPLWWALCLAGCGNSDKPAVTAAMTGNDQRNFRATAECVIQYGGERKKYPATVAEAVADCGDADLIEWVNEKKANLFLPQGNQEYQKTGSGKVLGWKHADSGKSLILLMSGAEETLEN